MAPLGPPKRMPAPARQPRSLRLGDLELEPRPDWAAGLQAAWQPGEKGAAAQLRRAVETVLRDYPASRNRPDQEGSSRLSPHLHFGELSAREVWHAVQARARKEPSPALNEAARVFLSEIGWREFGYHLLYYFPRTPEHPMRPEFERFPWNRDERALKAWQRGRTGYPIVDAGMKELWTTGWMHNRVRMIVASFLVKDLLIPWQEGARWFWDTLVDADLASNTLGWQWCAGCGVDAAPFFRMFNPVTQGERCDPEGRYVRRWIPSLARLPAFWIHRPWQAPAEVLAEANVALGKNYPYPLVDHPAARERALDAVKSIRRK
jgi:deoxyribodipyrimidine photo-lyase